MGRSLPGLSEQEERLVLLVSSGMSAAAAGRAAGYKSSGSASTVLKRPHIQAALEDIKRSIAENVVFGVAEAHAMLLDAYANAANSTEQRLAVESLMKLHRIGADGAPKNQTNIQVNIGKLDQASDEELLSIIGKGEGALDPSKHD
tara:strand:+ start:2919 stop:3356 length:438 start_codon:yes stop_codon:yes gene_type:complete